MKNFIVKKDEETNELQQQLGECREELMKFKFNKDVRNFMINV